MPQVVNTNVMSLNSMRQLNKSQLMQNQAMERLASGLRINSAKDDAAGLSISTGMDSQIKGLNQAVRNANDGISMAQTAEGSMSEMTNILQRMRELAVQASNDTNSASNRASIQSEIDQLYGELDRIASTTQFNGINLLDGSNASTSLQIGANSGEALSFSINAVTTTDLNLNAVSGLGEVNGGRIQTITAGAALSNVTINGVALGTDGAIAAAGTNGADTLKTEINDKTGLTGVTASAYNVVQGTAGNSGVVTGLELQVGGGTTITITASGSMQELVDNINRDASGVTAKLGSDGSLSLSNDTGKTITVSGTVTNSGLVADTYQGFVSLSNSDDTAITVNTNSAGSFSDLKTIGFNKTTGSDSLTGGAVDSNAITADDKIFINGVELGAVTGTTAADKAFAINAISTQTNVTAAASTDVEYTLQFDTIDGVGLKGLGLLSDLTVTNTTAALSGLVDAIDSASSVGAFNGSNQNKLKINGVTITALADVSSVDAAITAINNSGVQGVVATANTDGELVLTSSSGQNISVEYEAVTSTQVSGFTDVKAQADFQESYTTFTEAFVTSAGALATTGATTRGEITLTGTGGADVIVTSNATTETLKTSALDKLGLSDSGGNSTAVGIGLSVTSVDNANNSIDRIDSALEAISKSRGNLGAIQNRLQSTISNLENVSQSLSAANSRIKDADFAVETSKLSKAQILQQAGTSMLAQANAAGQSVLSLLG